VLAGCMSTVLLGCLKMVTTNNSEPRYFFNLYKFYLIEKGPKRLFSCLGMVTRNNSEPHCFFNLYKF
jgi:hypothetical protein